MEQFLPSCVVGNFLDYGFYILLFIQGASHRDIPTVIEPKQDSQLL